MVGSEINNILFNSVNHRLLALQFFVATRTELLQWKLVIQFTSKNSSFCLKFITVTRITPISGIQLFIMRQGVKKPNDDNLQKLFHLWNRITVKLRKS